MIFLYSKTLLGTIVHHEVFPSNMILKPQELNSSTETMNHYRSIEILNH